MKNPIAERPWLLVIVAFLIIIAVWLVVMRLSATVNTQRLTPAQEMEVLSSRPKP
ncbi:MAG: hypothetical protein WEB60_05155 [Terrimicrobiaceae bacterium]